METVPFDNTVYGDDFPATEKLYDADAYAVTFTAEVIRCHAAANPADGKQCFAVILDRTLFFPEEGGQTCDQGTFSQAMIDDGAHYHEFSPSQEDGNSGLTRVLHVAIDEQTGVITHYCDGAFSVGDRVRGDINFAHRFSNMQNHTGEHIFSGLVHSTFGFSNVGFHLSDDIMTMDYDGELSQADLAGIEYRANEAIWKNVPVRCFYPSEPELSQIEYRSKKALTGKIRIVEVEGYDICACCAPHVRRTGEIGLLTVLSAIHYKGGTRVSALCGKRGYEWLASVKGQAAGVSHILSVPIEEIERAAKKQAAEKKTCEYRISVLQQQILAQQLAAVPSDEADVLLFTEVADNMAIRNAVNRLTETRPGYVLILSGGDGGYRFILGSRDRDCREGAALLKAELSAKGGGSAEMVQGSLSASEEDIRNAFKRLAGR